MISRWERACLAVEEGLTSPAEVRRVLGVSTPRRQAEREANPHSRQVDRITDHASIGILSHSVALEDFFRRALLTTLGQLW